MKYFKNILVAALLLSGIAILFYPAASNLLSVRNSSKAILDYTVTVEQLTSQEIEKQFGLAEEYHRLYLSAGVSDPFADSVGHPLPENYTAVLNVNGIMGYVEIPAIQVNLPIYHSTASDVLKKGAGHLETSAFPIGELGRHAVLTAHRGLPTAKLFTDLNMLEVGDSFFIHILDRIFAYEVDQILTVEPQDTDALLPVPGEDYVTLITCTPYAINSHRLLVRGAGVPYEAEKNITETPSMVQSSLSRFLWPCIALGFVLLLFLLILSVKQYRTGKGGKP